MQKTLQGKSDQGLKLVCVATSQVSIPLWFCSVHAGPWHSTGGRSLFSQMVLFFMNEQAYIISVSTH